MSSHPRRAGEKSADHHRRGTLRPFFAKFHPERKGPILYFPGSSMCIVVGPPTEPSGELLLERGWGFASVNYDAVQPDNGADLVKGIIGLTNRGKPRKMDTWVCCAPGPGRSTARSTSCRPIRRSTPGRSV